MDELCAAEFWVVSEFEGTVGRFTTAEDAERRAKQVARHDKDTTYYVMQPSFSILCDTTRRHSLPANLPL